MKYDFETIKNRKNTNCLKWDLTNSEIPMWVADMDFKVAPEIQDALLKRTENEIYGYNIIPDELYESYIKWWGENYDLKIEKEELEYALGVMASISSIIRKLTQVGDSILIQTPVYHVFAGTILKNERKVVENKLKYEDEKYSIDFKDLDEKLENVKLMIFCNPHNPIGKTWSKEDLEKIGDLCLKHGTVLISDEIHCDLTDPGIKYTPFAKLRKYDKILISTYSPSKTFNIAGLQSSIVHSRNKELLRKIKEQLDIDENNWANCFGIPGVISAYNKGKPWLEELKEVLYHNKETVKKYLEENIKEIKLTPQDATYLLWLNIEDLKTDSKTFTTFLQDTTGLFLSPGVQFGENGDKFLRMNIACPEELLKKGLEKLKIGTEKFINEVNK